MGVVFGLFSGIFVGCLIMSLAETLDTVPTISRRIKLAVGLQYIILSIGLGKCVGSLLYFWYGMGRLTDRCKQQIGIPDSDR